MSTSATHSVEPLCQNKFLLHKGLARLYLYPAYGRLTPVFLAGGAPKFGKYKNLFFSLLPYWGPWHSGDIPAPMHNKITLAISSTNMQILQNLSAGKLVTTLKKKEMVSQCGIISSAWADEQHNSWRLVGCNNAHSRLRGIPAEWKSLGLTANQPANRHLWLIVEHFTRSPICPWFAKISTRMRDLFTEGRIILHKGIKA